MSEEKMRAAFRKLFKYEMSDDAESETFARGYQAAMQESEAGAEPIYQVYEGSTQTWMDATLNYYNSAMADGSRCRIVYLTPPSAQAIETAAIMKCADLLRNRSIAAVRAKNMEGHFALENALGEILALISQDGRTALEELLRKEKEQFGRKVAFAVYEQYDKLREDETFDGLKEIVTNLIGVLPLSSGAVSGEE